MAADRRRSQNGYRPPEPIGMPPIFAWPLRPAAALKWIFSGLLFPWGVAYIACWCESALNLRALEGGKIGGIMAPGLTPLETAIDRKLAVTVVVANNAQWGMIQNQQRKMWDRIYATSLRDVDYHKIFAAAGAHSQLVTDPDDFGPALKRAWDQEAPALIEVKTSSAPSPMTSGLVEMRVKTSIE